MSMRPGPADPAEPRVEDDERHQAEPEDRHRIADEADDAHDLVDEAAAPHRRPDAERNAEPGADERAERGELERRRKRAPDVLHHRVRRQHRRAEIAVQHLAHVDAELLPQRLVEAELLAHAGDHVLGRAVADDRQHRVDRDHPADEERDGEQAEEGEQDDDGEAPDDVRGRAAGGRWRARPPAICTAGLNVAATSSRP